MKIYQVSILFFSCFSVLAMERPQPSVRNIKFAGGSLAACARDQLIEKQRCENEGFIKYTGEDKDFLYGQIKKLVQVLDLTDANGNQILPKKNEATQFFPLKRNCKDYAYALYCFVKPIDDVELVAQRIQAAIKAGRYNMAQEFEKLKNNEFSGVQNLYKAYDKNWCTRCTVKKVKVDATSSIRKLFKK